MEFISSAVGPDTLQTLPTGPLTHTDEIEAFLEALKEHSGGLHICSRTVSLRYNTHKTLYV